jgi:hypothetical protein
MTSRGYGRRRRRVRTRRRRPLRETPAPPSGRRRTGSSPPRSSSRHGPTETTRRAVSRRARSCRGSGRMGAGGRRSPSGRRGKVGERYGDDGQRQHAPPAVDGRKDEREHDPQQPEPACVREPFENGIQPTRAVVDYPTLKVTVRRDQAGTICFVCSISARRSNGFPTKPCAPRSAASRSASSCPLNITTGIEPTP